MVSGTEDVTSLTREVVASFILRLQLMMLIRIIMIHTTK